MKPQDLYILYQSLVCKSPHLPSSISLPLQDPKKKPEYDVKSAKRRLQHIGLLDPKTALPNHDRVRLFLTEALSFWWPAAKAQKGQGLALALTGTGKALSPHSNGFTPVWPCSGEYADGDMISPLWDGLPQLAAEDRDIHEFFSLVEILRFSRNPLKDWAQKQMTLQLEKFQKLETQNYPDIQQDFLELREVEFETLVRFICSNGFRALTLSKAALLTRLPAHYFMERWETDQALRLWIAGKYHEQAYQFLGPLLGQIHEMNKGHLAVVLESFLSYVEAHEDYYKMSLWAYLESDPAIQEMSRRGMEAFFETVVTLFKKSKPEAMKRAELYAYLFSATWKVYAAFIWCDSKSLAKLVSLPQFKSELRDFILQSVFEKY